MFSELTQRTVLDSVTYNDQRTAFTVADNFVEETAHAMYRKTCLGGDRLLWSRRQETDQRAATDRPCGEAERCSSSTVWLLAVVTDPAIKRRRRSALSASCSFVDADDVMTPRNTRREMQFTASIVHGRRPVTVLFTDDLLHFHNRNGSAADRAPWSKCGHAVRRHSCEHVLIGYRRDDNL